MNSKMPCSGGEEIGHIIPAHTGGLNKEDKLFIETQESSSLIPNCIIISYFSLTTSINAKVYNLFSQNREVFVGNIHRIKIMF